MSTRYDNDSEDVVKENTKQTEAINKYIIGTLKIYITPEIFVKNTSGDTKKRKMPSIYYTRQYTKTLGEVQKIQKEITNEQAASKLPSGSGASGTSGITTGTGTGMGQQMQQRQMQQQQQQQQEQMQQQQQQQEQMQRQQQQQMQRPQQQMQQLVRQPVKVMGGGAEPMYGMGSMGMGGVSGLNFQSTSISSRVDQNAEPYIASLIKFSNAGFPSYSTLKSQVDTFFNLRAFRGFLKKLGNPITIRDANNQPINVENALLGLHTKNVNDKKTIIPTSIEYKIRTFFGPVIHEKSSEPTLKEYKSDKLKDAEIKFWSTNEVPQKIGKAFIFLYTIPSPQESRQQAQLSGQSRNTNANKPMMLMVKDGSEYSLIGGYVDNTIKTLLANNTQVTSESETQVTKFDVIEKTITKEFSSKTGTSFPSSIASKYLLYKPPPPPNHARSQESNESYSEEKHKEELSKKQKVTTEIDKLKEQLKKSRIRSREISADSINEKKKINTEIEETEKSIEVKEEELKKIEDVIYTIKKRLEKKNQDKEILPVIVYAVQVSQNNMQTIIQNSKSRTTLASGELVMVPIVTIYNVLAGKQISDNIAIIKFQSQLLQMTIGILQQEKIISQIADASQIGTDYYDDEKRTDELKQILSPDSINEIDDIIKHNIKFMLGIFFSYKNTFFYSGNQYIINSVDWNDTFQQLRDKAKLLKRMNASYYINLKLFLEKLEPGKLPSDRKGTFLESCGVKGAIIRNEWKNNFESKTLDGWKEVFGFGKKKEDEVKGEGIFDKIVPSFIKNAIKSIQNPLMSPLDAGVLQVSLIQYSLLSESELQEFYPNIENSFAGVAWKNDNTWEKRKQKLFTAMDESMADVYCFQNVQCSLDIYKKCITDAKLTEEDITKLQDINNPITYRKRLDIYFDKIHDALISGKNEDGANCVNDIYEKYKDSYEFVYFFEQVFYSSAEVNKHPINASGYIPDMLYHEYGKKVALGNLTMVKKSKFEVVKNLRYDVRMGASFCSGVNKTKFSKHFPELLTTKNQNHPGTIPNASSSSSIFEPSEDFRQQYETMCKNKSFGTMVYIKFRSSAPQQSESIVSEPAEVSEAEMEKEMEKDEKRLEEDNKEIIAENVDVDVELDVENPSGGQEGGAPSMWYDTDTTEVKGYDRKLNEDVSTKAKVKTKPKPPTDRSLCYGMKDSIFIPTSGNAGKQLFGICNIKFDTKDIVTTGKQGDAPGLTKYLPEDVMQVILMAVFLNRLKYIMQQFTGLGVLTNLVQKPLIFSGFFRDVIKSEQLSYALKLLTTSNERPWINKDDVHFGTKIKGGDDNPLIKFVQDMNILKFLRVGKIRVACFYQSFNEDKQKFDKFNSNLLGDFYPLKTGSSNSSSVSELIICCDNFKICDDSKIMHKMIPARNTKPNFPIFPNSANPSNSVAIGAVFDITTSDIKSHVELVKESVIQRKKEQEDAVVKAQTALVQREREEQQTATFKKYFNQPSAPPIEPIKILPPSNSPPQPESRPPSGPASAPAPASASAPAAAPAPPPVPPPPGPPKPPGPPPPPPLPSGVTKYIFAFDMDDTLFRNHSLVNLSTNPSDVQYRSEVIANMKRVINSDNYVWIVTANHKYTKDIFTTNFFGPDKDFFDKSYYYFLFMNPADMGKVYKEAKEDASLPASDTAKLDYHGNWTDTDIHKGGLKPYAIYAQSLFTRSEYNKKFNPKIGKFDVYLFDDKSGPIQTNSKKFSIHFTQVTDFDTSPVPNLLTEFKKVLDDGTSKIGSAKAPFIPDEYKKYDVIGHLMADDNDLPKCDSATHVNKPDFTRPTINIPNNMIGDINGGGGKISNNLEVCTNGDSKCGIPPPVSYSTDSDIRLWTTSSGDIYSDHEPIKYNYVTGEDTNIVTCTTGSTPNDDINTSFITWNIAYRMTHTGNFYLSKFYCSQATNPKTCIEDDKIYEKRMQNILTAIDTIMKNEYNKYTNYVFLQECTSKLLYAVKNVTTFDSNFQILHKGKSEFCLVVRKSAVPDPSSDIIVFDFYENKDGSPAMSKYISQQFDSYDIDVNTPDLKRVMCYIVKSKATIFFNVHFRFNDKAPYIFQRQAELYNFMNAIVYSIRSIPKENAELREYQNYDIVFTGDFNVNMLRRFPRDIKRFGYPDGNIIPIFFTCNYIEGQKTIISTTYNNLPTARATNGDKNNYNLTNIDFSILYPRIGDAGTTPIEVNILNDGIPKKKTLPTGSETPGSSENSTYMPKPPLAASASASATTLKVMSFNTWYKPFTPDKNNMEYCNVTKGGKSTNVCQENIMNEIMEQINNGFQVIFLQEFTSRITEVFDKNKCKFSDTKQIPFTMTYTPPGGGSPVEYYVYSVYAVGETITTLCSKTFFPTPATQYYMGNLTSFPNNPSYASDGNITRIWDISGGGRPYIVLVFDDKKMILINIHGPHGEKFSPDLQKIQTTTAAGINLLTAIKDLNHPISAAVQTEITKKNKDVEDLNKEYTNLQSYTFRQLGNMLRDRISDKLNDYEIIIGGDFNMNPDDAKTHLAKLSKRLSAGKYVEGPFSNSSGKFDKHAQNSLKLKVKVDDIDTDATGTCCVTKQSKSSYGSGIYDQIYSNKLNITKYWTYGGKIEYDKQTGGILFSDHLPVYAEIELPASGTYGMASPSGGSRKFTLRNNNNNKPTSRKIRKSTSTSASTSVSMPTTRFTKKQHSHNKKHKTRRHKH